jgi:hypothetical protein
LIKRNKNYHKYIIILFILVPIIFIITINYKDITNKLSKNEISNIKTSPEIKTENNETKNNYNSQVKIMITKVEPNEITAGKVFNPINGQAAMGIRGENFNKNCMIYINDQPLITTFGSTMFITTIVPNNLYENPGVIQVQVKELNNKLIVNQSNKVEIVIK